MVDNTLSPDDFAFVARFLREQCAVVLEPGKEYLVKARLTPVAQKLGLPGISQLLQQLRLSNHEELRREVMEAMVTTETSFFRDLHPFEALRHTVIPRLIELRRTQRALHIWCAASSSGQEPYSLAMLLREHFPELNSWRIVISATDVSRAMLRRSQEGCFSQVEINRGLPASLLLKWFRQEGATWRIDERLRKAVTFSQLNLAQVWPAMPTWDLIFLRNVMIYFDHATKQAILERAAGRLARDGFLLLGGAETTFGLHDAFERVESLKSGFFRLRSG